MTHDQAIDRAERAEAERDELERALAVDERELSALRRTLSELDDAIAVACQEVDAARAAARLPGSLVVAAAVLGVLVSVLTYIVVARLQPWCG